MIVVLFRDGHSVRLAFIGSYIVAVTWMRDMADYKLDRDQS